MKLGNVLKDKVISEVMLVAEEKFQAPLYVLVGDTESLKILSSCIKVYELNDIGIGAVLNVEYEREPMPGIPVVYVISSPESVDRVISDYSKDLMYGKACLFSTFEFDGDAMEKLSTSVIMDHLQELRQVSFNFQAIESNLALAGKSDSAFGDLYMPAMETDRSAEVKRLADCIVSLCITIGQIPIIRYDETGSKFLKRLSGAVERELRNSQDKIDLKEEGEKPILLLLDRSVDVLAPLMHEFTYQALAFDLLESEGNVVILKDGSKSNKFLLSQDESTYSSLQHQHISSVSQSVTQQFENFKSQNATAKLYGSKEEMDLKAIAKNLPQFKKEMRIFSKHLSLAKGLLDAIDARKLHELSILEQDMATGVDEHGEKTKKKDMQGRLLSIVQDPAFQLLDKLRLIMIYIISQGGVSAATRKLLLRDQSAPFTDNQVESVSNLTRLNVDVQVDKENKNPNEKYVNKMRIQKSKAKSENFGLQLMRYRPLLEDILGELLEGTLSDVQYPYIGDVPENVNSDNGNSNTGVRSARKKKWGLGNKDKSSDNHYESGTSPKVIVFVAGGLTYSESRVAYEISEKYSKEVLIASSHICTPEKFMNSLSDA